VINCAGFTNVDRCEINPLQANLLNYQLPVNLSNTCAELGLRFVQISTDHFENLHTFPYTEVDFSTPVNAYGHSKRRAEDYLIQNFPTALIVRTNFFGSNPKISHSSLDTVVSRLKDGHIMDGFDDVHFTPVALQELARALSVLLTAGAIGVVHVSGNESISKYDFLRMIAKKYCFSD
jgi:dTDP-4-dehydrorhamnose reductase